jgi:hypothetical protein
MPSNDVNSRRAQLAALRRWKGADDPAVYRARVALQEETFVSAIERALRSAPPITPALHARVLALLAAVGRRAGR